MEVETAAAEAVTNGASAGQANGGNAGKKKGTAEDWGTVGYLTADQASALEKLRGEVLEHARDPESESEALAGYADDDLCLLRFMRARKFKTRKALRMILDEAKWREQFEGHVFRISDFTSMLGFMDDGVAKLGGRDREGRPVMYVRPSKFFPAQINSHEELVLFYVYYMDSLLSLAAECDREDFTVITDMSGWTFKNFSLPIFKVVISILQDFYPERLGRCYVVSTPMLFRSGWGLVRPLLDERTRLKIHILGSNFRPILDDVAAESLEEKYGGEHEPYPERDAIVAPIYERELKFLEDEKAEEATLAAEAAAEAATNDAGVGAGADGGESGGESGFVQGDGTGDEATGDEAEDASSAGSHSGISGGVLSSGHRLLRTTAMPLRFAARKLNLAGEERRPARSRSPFRTKSALHRSSSSPGGGAGAGAKQLEALAASVAEDREAVQALSKQLAALAARVDAAEASSGRTERALSDMAAKRDGDRRLALALAVALAVALLAMLLTNAGATVSAR